MKYPFLNKQQGGIQNCRRSSPYEEMSPISLICISAILEYIDLPIVI